MSGRRWQRRCGSGERTSEESKTPGEGVDTSQAQVAKEIGAVSVGESDVKLDEAVFEAINSAWRECEEELHYDAMSGKVMIKELVEAARRVEMETFKKRGVCEMVPTECARWFRLRNVGGDT